MTPREDEVMQAGLDAASAEGKTPEEARAAKEEEAQVRKWLARIEEAREFDKEIWQEMATDRGYAAGLSAHAVSVNLIGSAVDTMKSTLYARNPDVAVVPARQTSLPTVERPIPPPGPPVNPIEQISGIAAQVSPEGAPPVSLMADPMVQAKVAPLLEKYDADVAEFDAAMAMFNAEMQAYGDEMKNRRLSRETRKRFSETLEILISKSWALADLKTEARVAVGATLTTKIGWMKLAWHEDQGLDPVSNRRLASLQENIRLIDDLRARAKDGQGTENLDALRQETAEAIAALNAAVEVVTARGLVCDSIPPEDMTVPIGVTRVASATASSPWLAQRIFMSCELARREFPEVPDECWKSAQRYSQRKPKMALRVAFEAHPGIEVSSASDASQFTQGPDGMRTEMVSGAEGEFVCIHEVWDKEAGIVRTVCEGVKRYVRPPHAPEISVTRFYPFYNMAFVEADGLRYPQSMVQRSRGLQDEYNARRSSLKAQRDRAKQGILADGSAIDKDEMNKIVSSVEGEITVIDTTGNKPIQNVFMAKPTVQLDPALYEVDSIRRDFEEMWGLQQARMGGVRVEQTATEAEIQDAGFNARITFMREPLETMLNEMSIATAEMLLQRLSLDDAIEYAGPGAVWPEAASVSDLATLVSVTIKAGSTGKPNTSAERNAWAQTMPMMTQLITQIGTLRGAAPTEVADKLEQMADITLRLSGSSIDVEQIIPQESMPNPAQMGMPAPGMEMQAPPPPQGPMGPSAPPSMIE